MFIKTLLGLSLLSLSIRASDYTTYIGDRFNTGASTLPYINTTSMNTDAAGNTYFTGSRITDLLNDGANGSTDAFVTKLDPAGQIVFTRFFGGVGPWKGQAVAVDPAGNIYVAGTAGSRDLLVSNALQTSPSGSFIVKFSGDGRTVLYSTYFGVSGATTVSAIATDAAGNLYLTGMTFDRAFPVTPGMPSDSSVSILKQDVFVTKISATGDRILFSGMFGGAKIPCPQTSCSGLRAAVTSGVGIAVDSQGSAYIAGNTNTTDLPVTQGVLAAEGIGAFVAKVNTAGTGLAFVTYLGSANSFSGVASLPGNVLHAVSVDSSGNTYLAGATDDLHFPVTAGAYQTSFAGTPSPNSRPRPTNAFAAKLAPDGSKMIWATYIGGPGANVAQSIASDPQGNAWIVGTTTSSSFPNTNGWSNGNDFLVEVAASGSALTYAARYPNDSVGLAVGFDSTTGLVHASGPTGIVVGIAPEQPPTIKVFGITNAAGGETTGRVATRELIAIYGSHIGPATPVIANIGSSGTFPTSLGGVQVSFDGQIAQLLYVSDGQINAIVPGVDNPGTMTITNGNKISPSFPIAAVSASPQVFRNQDGSAIALNQDGSLNSAANRAKPGTPVTIWVTGISDPSVPPGPVAFGPCYASGCQVNIYGSVVPGPIAKQATVVSAGPAPGFPHGVTQITFELPTSGNGSVDFNVSQNSYASDPVVVYTTIN